MRAVAPVVIAVVVVVVMATGAGVYYVTSVQSQNSNSSTSSWTSETYPTTTWASTTATPSIAFPTLAVALQSSSLVAGGSTFATATLSGATDAATGSIVFYVYEGSSCSGDQEWVSQQDVSAGGNYGSAEHEFDQSGSFSWNAVYSGDSGNSGATSNCATVEVSPPPVPEISIAVNQTIVDDPQGLLILNITAGNAGNQNYTFAGDLQLRTESGKLYETFPSSVTYAISWPASGRPHPFPGGVIPAGGKIAGEVAFSVPSNETAVALVYQDVYSGVNATASIPSPSSWVSEVQGTGTVTITPSDLECGFGGGMGACFTGQYVLLNDSILGSADYYTGQVVGVQVTIFLGAGQGSLLGFTAISGVSAFQVVSWTQFDCTGGNPTCSQWTFDIYLTTTPGTSYSGGPDIVVSLQQG